jgi:hypothetical protein
MSTVVLVFSQVLFCCLFCELSDLTSPGIHPETRIFYFIFWHESFSRCKHFCYFFLDSYGLDCAELPGRVVHHQAGLSQARLLCRQLLYRAECSRHTSGYTEV